MSVLHNRSKGHCRKDPQSVSHRCLVLMQDDKGSRMLARLQVNHRSPCLVSIVRLGRHNYCSTQLSPPLSVERYPQAGVVKMQEKAWSLACCLKNIHGHGLLPYQCIIMRSRPESGPCSMFRYFQARANADDASPTEAEQSGDRTLPEEVLGVWREPS